MTAPIEARPGSGIRIYRTHDTDPNFIRTRKFLSSTGVDYTVHEWDWIATEYLKAAYGFVVDDAYEDNHTLVIAETESGVGIDLFDNSDDVLLQELGESFAKGE